MWIFIWLVNNFGFPDSYDSITRHHEIFVWSSLKIFYDFPLRVSKIISIKALYKFSKVFNIITLLTSLKILIDNNKHKLFNAHLILFITYLHKLVYNLIIYTHNTSQRVCIIIVQDYASSIAFVILSKI